MLFPSGSTLDNKILLICFALLFKPRHKRNDVNLLQCNPADMHLEFTIHSNTISVKLILNFGFKKIYIMNFLIFKYKQIGTIIGETKREGQRKAKKNQEKKKRS
jgi:hypothetical protein